MPQPSLDPTKLGTVEDVTGPRISVKLGDTTAHGLLFHRGEGYRVGQVGSFVRIPAGYVDLFGIVVQVGAGAAPATLEGTTKVESRWLRVELVGEGRRGGKFERGISQYPSIGDPVHVVTESDLRSVYAPADSESHVAIGRVASSEGIRAYVDLNRLVSRHCAVVGSTGAGKSTAVASLLSVVSDQRRFPAARVVLLDLHGEYAKAFGDTATVFRLAPGPGSDEQAFFLPFWALGFEELASLCCGGMDDKQRSVIGELVVTLKREALANGSVSGIRAEDVTVDTPVPFSIRQLWFRQHCREHRMVTKKQGGSADEVMDALVLDSNGKPEQPGDAEKLIPPKYRTSKTTGPKDEHVTSANEGSSLRQQCASLHVKLKDERMAFLFRPGDWSPDLEGKTKKDLDALLSRWLCAEKPISVLDLSGIAPAVRDDLVGALLRILFDAMFWARHLPEGGRHRPLLVVLEEAHSYLGKGDKDKEGSGAGRAAKVARQIAKEGRKYGVGLMLVSQRPSEIDGTILAQCGTTFALRLTNEADRGHIRSCSSDNLEGLFAMLPILRTGEALIVGEAVNMPVRAIIDQPPEGHRPDSDDPLVVAKRGLDGKRKPRVGWTEALQSENYATVVRAWRTQNPTVVLTAHSPAISIKQEKK